MIDYKIVITRKFKSYDDLMTYLTNKYGHSVATIIEDEGIYERSEHYKVELIKVKDTYKPKV